MTLHNHGRISWGGGREKDMHRTYWIKFLVESDSKLDGPNSITQAAGLPNIGSAWNYGNENDPWALCYPNIECDSIIKKGPNYFWYLKYTFSTKPFRICAMQDITDPLSVPDRIGGSFVNYQKRVHNRRDGSPIISSSVEPIYVDYDLPRATVSITQTVLNLGLYQFTQMINTLNDSTLWGMPKRCIKLRNVPWKRLVWGQCTFYYERTLEFDVAFDSFDLTDVRDQGHRVIDKTKAGYLARTCTGTGTGDEYFGTIDRNDPDNFERSTDAKGNIRKIILLDGKGEMCHDPVSHRHFIDTIELYNESNFLLLGIPVTL